MQLISFVIVLAVAGTRANLTSAAPFQEVCCGDLGCFRNDGIFFDLVNRPISLSPNCAVASNFKLNLNTPLNPVSPQLLDPNSLGTIQTSNFDTTLPTKILIHGFTDRFYWDWWKDMVSALLGDGAFNVIRLDWSSGNIPPYAQASANTRVAGAYVAKFINLLKSEFNYPASKIHIIGHSLGAHIAGYAGERVDKVARISGVDPAGLFFQYMDPRVRLDPTDAVVVDTIIADGEPIISLGFGSLEPMGHINFYANGGNKQPGCGQLLTAAAGPTSFSSTNWDISSIAAQTIYQTVGCNHWRALSLYTESIGRKKCAMISQKCDTYDNYLLAKCRGSDGDKRSKMGYYANISFAQDGVVKNYSTQTTDRPPFCTKSYRLGFGLQNRTITNNAQEQKGIIYVTLNGVTSKSRKIQVTPDVLRLTPGTHLDYVFPVSEDVGNMQSVTFSWDSKSLMPNLLQKQYLLVNENLVVENDNGTVFSFKFDLKATQVEDKKDSIAYH